MAFDHGDKRDPRFSATSFPGLEKFRGPWRGPSGLRSGQGRLECCERRRTRSSLFGLLNFRTMISFKVCHTSFLLRRRNVFETLFNVTEKFYG